LYLKAVHVGSQGIQNAEKATELLERALEIDPEFALAYALLANNHLRRGLWHGDLKPAEALNKALPAAKKALELEPDLGSALLVMGNIQRWFYWDFEKAETFLAKAPVAYPLTRGAFIYKL